MLIFLFIISGLVSCFFFAFLFSLVKVAKRADKDEEKFMNIFSTSIINSENPASVIKLNHQEKIHVM